MAGDVAVEVPRVHSLGLATQRSEEIGERERVRHVIGRQTDRMAPHSLFSCFDHMNKRCCQPVGFMRLNRSEWGDSVDLEN